MPVHNAKLPPPGWAAHKAPIRNRWTLPFHYLEWIWLRAAHFLGNWAFLRVLDHIGRFSILVGVFFYFHEAGDRKKQKHYQAWQVINTAQGKGGSGGRIEALHELNKDRVPLVGVNAEGAFLQGVDLVNANLLRADLSGSDLRNGNLQHSNLEYANLSSANFRGANLHAADLKHADLEEADLADADLRSTDLADASLKNADLTNTDLQGIKWEKIQSIEGANIFGVRNAPDGFVDWALKHKAASTPPVE